MALGDGYPQVGAYPQNSPVGLNGGLVGAPTIPVQIGAAVDAAAIVTALDEATPEELAQIQSSVSVGAAQGGSCINFNATNLRKTRAAIEKARTGGAPWVLAGWGDSTQGGVGCTPHGQFTVTRQIVNAMSSAGLSRNGSRFGAMVKDSADDSRIVKSGFNIFNQGTCMANTAATGATATFTSDLPGTVARVWYLGSGAGFSVSIDGGTAVAVSIAGGGVQKYEVTGLANTTHTIAITTPSTTNVQLLGFEVASTAGGVRECNVAYGGVRASQQNEGNFFDTRQILKSANFMQPTTCLVGFGYNDLIDGYQVADLTACTTLIDSLTAAGIEVIVQLLNPSTTRLAAAAALNAALKQAAAARSLPLLDSSLLWGTQAAGMVDGFYADDVHLLGAGYGRQGRAIAAALLSL